MRKKFRQILVFPYTDKKMEARIKMIMDRLSELHHVLNNKACDQRSVARMIRLNELILELLVNGKPVRFYHRAQTEYLEPLNLYDT